MVLKIAVLASTRGTDLQAIINSMKNGELKGVAELACVIADRECYAAERASAQGFEAIVLDKSKFASREEFDKHVAELLWDRGVQLVCLVGYMRILSPYFVERFRNRIINVHPSLLPAFPGGMDKSVHQLVLDSGVKVTGCTFHFVDESVDAGPIIAQEAVHVREDDNAESLKQRVQAGEQRLYPRVIKLFAEDNLCVEGKRVRVLECGACMPARILDGRKTSEKILAVIAGRVNNLRREKGIAPGLAAILVGSDEASKLYVHMKRKAAQRCGFYNIVRELPENAGTQEIIDVVQEFNEDERVHGVLVQLPLPKQVDCWRVLESIDVRKDVDGLSSASLGALAAKQECFVSATALAVLELLKQTGVGLSGKNACVIGAGVQTGRPLTILLLNELCTVTTCHIATQNLSEHTHDAEILVSAVGKPGLVKSGMVRDGAIVIDVGVSKIGDKVVGDVDFESVVEKASWITPVPGGVGPVTVAMLLRNTLKAAEKIV